MYDIYKRMIGIADSKILRWRAALLHFRAMLPLIQAATHFKMRSLLFMIAMRDAIDIAARGDFTCREVYDMPPLYDAMPAAAAFYAWPCHCIFSLPHSFQKFFHTAHDARWVWCCVFAPWEICFYFAHDAAITPRYAPDIIPLLPPLIFYIAGIIFAALFITHLLSLNAPPLGFYFTILQNTYALIRWYARHFTSLAMYNASLYYIICRRAAHFCEVRHYYIVRGYRPLKRLPQAAACLFSAAARSAA